MLLNYTYYERTISNDHPECTAGPPLLWNALEILHSHTFLSNGCGINSFANCCCQHIFCAALVCTLLLEFRQISVLITLTITINISQWTHKSDGITNSRPYDEIFGKEKTKLPRTKTTARNRWAWFSLHFLVVESFQCAENRISHLSRSAKFRSAFFKKTKYRKKRVEVECSNESNWLVEEIELFGVTPIDTDSKLIGKKSQSP